MNFECCTRPNLRQTMCKFSLVLCLILLTGCSTYQYKGVRVIETDFVLSVLNENARGMVLRYVILHKKPLSNGQICTPTGCKSVDRVLKHEYCHIEQQRQMGMVYFYHYLTDKQFELEMEREATLYETQGICLQKGR